MTKLTLYYPGFAEPDGEPESTEFNSLDDLKKDLDIKDRMFGLFGLRKTFAYKDLTPESGRRGFYKHVFHKASAGGYWGSSYHNRRYGRGSDCWAYSSGYESCAKR